MRLIFGGVGGWLRLLGASEIAGAGIAGVLLAGHAGAVVAIQVVPDQVDLVGQSVVLALGIPIVNVDPGWVIVVER